MQHPDAVPCRSGQGEPTRPSPPRASLTITRHQRARGLALLWAQPEVNQQRGAAVGQDGADALGSPGRGVRDARRDGDPARGDQVRPLAVCGVASEPEGRWTPRPAGRFPQSQARAGGGREGGWLRRMCRWGVERTL